MEPDDPSQEDWQASLREQQNFSRGLDLWVYDAKLLLKYWLSQRWGNVPAVDTLNVKNNEGVTARNQDLALAYVGKSCWFDRC